MKRPIHRAALGGALALSLGLAGAADAAVLIAGPISQPANATLRCTLANLSGKPRESIVLEILDSDGVVRGTHECGAAPLEVCYFDVPGQGFPAYCRMTAPGGRSGYRGTLEARTGGASPSTVVVAPAQ